MFVLGRWNGSSVGKFLYPFLWISGNAISVEKQELFVCCKLDEMPEVYTYTYSCALAAILTIDFNNTNFVPFN